MSRQTARNGLQVFLAASLPTVGTVYGSFPTTIPGQAFSKGQPAGAAAGAVIVVFVAAERESRIAIGGVHGGWKRVDYSIQLHIFHRYLTDNAEAAMADFDILVETVKALLRSDRTAGGTFWQQGEQSLDGTYGEPSYVRGVVETWAQIDFTATEMIQS